MEKLQNPFRSNYEELRLDHLCQPITSLIDMRKRKMPMILFAFYCPIRLFWDLLRISFCGDIMISKWYSKQCKKRRKNK